MKITAENVGNALIGVAAALVIIILIRREFVQPQERALPDRALKPQYVSNWRAIQRDGIRIGSQEASIHIVEFVDLECPSCAWWHTQMWPAIKKRYGENVSLTLVHLPLPSHRFAPQAAAALECATRQNRTSEFLFVIYEHQDSIGLLPWSAYGSRAKLPNLTHFRDCMNSDSFPRIAAGRRWATSIRANGTPTFIINGWRPMVNPSESEMVDLISRVAEGRNPGP